MDCVTEGSQPLGVLHISLVAKIKWNANPEVNIQEVRWGAVLSRIPLHLKSPFVGWIGYVFLITHWDLCKKNPVKS